MATIYSTKATITSEPESGTSTKFLLVARLADAQYADVQTFDKSVDAFKSIPNGIDLDIKGEIHQAREFTASIGGGKFELKTPDGWLHMRGPIEGGPIEPVEVKGRIAFGA